MRFSHLLQVGATHHQTYFDELAHEVIFACLKKEFELVGRELGFGLHGARLAAVDLRVEKHIGCADAHAIAVNPQILAQSLTEHAVAIQVSASLAFGRQLEFFGLGRLLFGSHIDRSAASHPCFQSLQ